jgi:hypothetical protein
MAPVLLETVEKKKNDRAPYVPQTAVIEHGSAMR